MKYTDLLDKVVNDGRYLSICRQLVGVRKHLADDLRQEAMIVVCLMDKEKLIELESKSELEIYIVGIINKLWNKRNQVKYHHDGSTSPFMEYTSTTTDERRLVNSEYFNYDPKADKVFYATKKILKEDCNSNDMDRRYKARVYNFSHDNMIGLTDGKGNWIAGAKNPRQFAESSNIPYSAVIKTYNSYKEILRNKLNKLLND